MSDGEGNEPEIEMNWNIMHFLPEAAACQNNFNVSRVISFLPFSTYLKTDFYHSFSNLVL